MRHEIAGALKRAWADGGVTDTTPGDPREGNTTGSMGVIGEDTGVEGITWTGNNSDRGGAYLQGAWISDDHQVDGQEAEQVPPKRQRWWLTLGYGRTRRGARRRGHRQTQLPHSSLPTSSSLCWR